MGATRVVAPLRIALLLVALPVGAQTLPDTQIVSLHGLAVKTFATPYGRNAMAWGHSLPSLGLIVNVSVGAAPRPPEADARVFPMVVCGQRVSRVERTIPAVPAQRFSDEALRDVGSWRLGNPWTGAGLPRDAQPERVDVAAYVTCGGEWFYLSWNVETRRRAELRAREEAFFAAARCEARRD
jgi:hypothetical protein